MRPFQWRPLQRRSFRRWFLHQLLFLATAGLMVAIALFMPHPVNQSASTASWSRWLGTTPAIAQIFDRRDTADRVYELLPDFPLENHYIHSETDEVDTGNTLVHRLIQYHYDVQSRPLNSRFDWKLTLADYLGANEWMDADTYPDRRLQSNPYENDVAVIRTLNRQQREDLIQALLSVIVDQ